MTQVCSPIAGYRCVWALSKVPGPHAANRMDRMDRMDRMGRMGGSVDLTPLSA
eukprot:COSAG01_NODE_2380_length_7793_cov_118.038602_1_plen_53_part_00